MLNPPVLSGEPSVLDNCPNAIHVFDHFHVVKLMNDKLDDIRRMQYNMEKDINKRKVLKAKDSDTIVTGRIAGHPVRGLKNKFARAARSAELKEALDGAEQELRHAGSLRRAAIDGDLETGSFMAGEVAGMVHERGSAAGVVQGLMAEAERILNWNAEQLLAHNEIRKNL